MPTCTVITEKRIVDTYKSLQASAGRGARFMNPVTVTDLQNALDKPSSCSGISTIMDYLGTKYTSRDGVITSPGQEDATDGIQELKNNIYSYPDKEKIINALLEARDGEEGVDDRKGYTKTILYWYSTIPKYQYDLDVDWIIKQSKGGIDEAKNMLVNPLTTKIDWYGPKDKDGKVDMTVKEEVEKQFSGQAIKLNEYNKNMGKLFNDLLLGSMNENDANKDSTKILWATFGAWQTRLEWLFSNLNPPGNIVSKLIFAIRANDLKKVDPGKVQRLYNTVYCDIETKINLFKQLDAKCDSYKTNMKSIVESIKKPSEFLLQLSEELPGDIDNDKRRIKEDIGQLEEYKKQIQQNAEEENIKLNCAASNSMTNMAKGVFSRAKGLFSKKTTQVAGKRKQRRNKTNKLRTHTATKNTKNTKNTKKKNKRANHSKKAKHSRKAKKARKSRNARKTRKH